MDPAWGEHDTIEAPDSPPPQFDIDSLLDDVPPPVVAPAPVVPPPAPPTPAAAAPTAQPRRPAVARSAAADRGADADGSYHGAIRQDIAAPWPLRPAPSSTTRGRRDPRRASRPVAAARAVGRRHGLGKGNPIVTGRCGARARASVGARRFAGSGAEGPRAAADGGGRRRRAGRPRRRVFRMERRADTAHHRRQPRARDHGEHPHAHRGAPRRDRGRDVGDHRRPPRSRRAGERRPAATRGPRAADDARAGHPGAHRGDHGRARVEAGQRRGVPGART